jgi:hypothetical protein
MARKLTDMADTIYTRALSRAAEIQGSTQALASLLRVPENTLLRWMAGRAQMPLQAFLNLIELLVKHEETGGGEPRLQDVAEGEKLSFRMGDLVGHCARCDGTEFTLASPGPAVKFTSKLACCACGEVVVHGNLIAQLARDAVYHSRAMTAARARRQADLAKKTPKLQPLKQAAEEGPTT